MAQEQQRATDRALSTLATANQKHIDTATKKWEHFQRQGNDQLLELSRQAESILHHSSEQVMENAVTMQRELESKVAEMKYSFQTLGAQATAKLDEVLHC